MKPLITYLLLMFMAFYTMPSVGSADNGQEIVLHENEMPDKNKSEEKKQQEKEVFSFQFTIHSVTAANPYADTHFLLPAPIKNVSLPPPDLC